MGHAEQRSEPRHLSAANALPDPLALVRHAQHGWKSPLAGLEIGLKCRVGCKCPTNGHLSLTVPQTSACLTKGPCASVMCSARQGEQSCLRLRSVLHHGNFRVRTTLLLACRRLCSSLPTLCKRHRHDISLPTLNLYLRCSCGLPGHDYVFKQCTVLHGSKISCVLSTSLAWILPVSCSSRGLTSWPLPSA